MTSRKTDIHVLAMPVGGMDEALRPEHRIFLTMVACCSIVT
jgi:hypothetical protein